MCCTEWPCAVTSENYVSDPGTEPETITAHGCNVYYESAESQPPLPAFPHNEGCLPRIYITFNGSPCIIIPTGSRGAAMRPRTESLL